VAPSTVKHHLLVDKAEGLAEPHFEISHLALQAGHGLLAALDIGGPSTLAHSADAVDCHRLRLQRHHTLVFQTHCAVLPLLMIPFSVLHLNPIYIDTLTDHAGIEDATTAVKY
jgi:hypothetical protein